MGKYVKLIPYRLKSMWHQSPHMHTCTHHPHTFTVFYVFALYFWLIIFLFTLLTVRNFYLLSLADSIIQFYVQFLKNSSYLAASLHWTCQNLKLSSKEGVFFVFFEGGYY